MLGSEEQAFEKRLALRMAVIDTAREMNRRGINVNKSGNVSARTSGGRSFFITPTGIPYESLEPDDIVEVSLDAERFEGRCLPSSEWEMHAEIYRRRPDAGAVVHTHSCYATALACQNLPIPAFHYMVATAGGRSIDVAPYATFGTRELAVRGANALEAKKCMFARTPRRTRIRCQSCQGAHACGRGGKSCAPICRCEKSRYPATYL